MDKEIKAFIEKYINLIDTNQWDRLYQEVLFGDDYFHLIVNGLFDLTSFNTLLLKAGINPLEHMTYVPSNFLYGSGFTKITLPENIISISAKAFCSCQDLKDINLGSIGAIWDRAFEGDISLDSIVLRDRVSLGRYVFSEAHIQKLYAPKYINYKANLSAFDNCIIDNLYYDGKESEFDNLSVESLFRDSKINNIIFSI